MSATVTRRRMPMTLLDAGAAVAGLGSSWASSTKWPSGSCTMTARVLFVALIASGIPPLSRPGPQRP